VSAPSAEDLRDGCDAVQADMAEHQRLIGREVTAGANQTLAAETFERLEKEGAFDPAPPAIGAAPAPAPAVGTVHREVEGRAYTIDRAAADDIATRPATPDEGGTVRRVVARLEQLIALKDGMVAPGVPGLAIRAMAVLWWLAKPLEELAQLGIFSEDARAAAFWADAMPLLEASSRLFGDWKAADPDPKIYVGASG
jgi:hypothetical protein